MTSEDIAGALREKREARGWTYVELSEASGVNRNLIADIETGRKTPKIGTLTALFGALGWKLTLKFRNRKEGEGDP